MPPEMLEKVAVLGDGAWGTALAGLLAENGVSVIQWSHESDRAERMQSTRTNEEFLPGYLLPEGVTVTAEPEVFAHANVVVSAVPSQFLRGALSRMKDSLGSETPVVSVTKGLEFPSQRRPTEVITEVLGPRPLAVLSGPSHAEEVVASQPSAVVVGSEDRGLALHIQDLFSANHFRVYTSGDLVGVELGGALKNVLAIAGGLIDGLGLGDNTKAALLTRGLAEMSRLGQAMGGEAETFYGLSGVGDLIVSCISKHGRNRFVGERLGMGESLDQVMKEVSGVPEGVPTSRTIVEWAADRGLDAPICEQVDAVVREGRDPAAAVESLMTRPQTDEVAATGETDAV